MGRHALLAFAAGLLIAADGPTPVDILKQKAESDFHLRDRNSDGYLSWDEMTDQLKAELDKWDTNRDSLISLEEYRLYYGANRQNHRGNGTQPFIPLATAHIDDEDEALDAHPQVFRAGKLPVRELPSWFMELDIDNDGQVALL
jgi:hypothetical protein